MPNKNNVKDINYAWEWFRFHADQRTYIFYFYLLISGSLLYGYLQIINSRDFPIKLTLYLWGIISSFGFYILEKRNEELVNYGRDVLESNDFTLCIEDHRRKKLKNFPIRLSYFVTHSFIFRLFIISMGLFWLYQLWVLCKNVFVNLPLSISAIIFVFYFLYLLILKISDDWVLFHKTKCSKQFNKWAHDSKSFYLSR